MKPEEYRQNKLASGLDNTQELKLPSGAVFVMRLAPITMWVQIGILPASLASKMVVAAKMAGTEAAMVVEQIASTFTEEDFLTQQNLNQRMIEYCCVEPRVSMKPVEDALSIDELAPIDVEAILKFCWSGGKTGEGLENFRTERQ